MKRGCLLYGQSRAKFCLQIYRDPTSRIVGSIKVFFLILNRLDLSQHFASIFFIILTLLPLNYYNLNIKLKLKLLVKIKSLLLVKFSFSVIVNSHGIKNIDIIFVLTLKQFINCLDNSFLVKERFKEFLKINNSIIIKSSFYVNLLLIHNIHHCS